MVGENVLLQKRVAAPQARLDDVRLAAREALDLLQPHAHHDVALSAVCQTLHTLALPVQDNKRMRKRAVSPLGKRGSATVAARELQPYINHEAIGPVVKQLERIAAGERIRKVDTMAAPAVDDRQAEALRNFARRVRSAAEDEDVADHPAAAAARRAVEPYDEGESGLSKADESLLDMERSSVREAVAKAAAPTKAAVKKAADTLGLVHLKKFDSYVAEVGDPRRYE